MRAWLTPSTHLPPQSGGSTGEAGEGGGPLHHSVVPHPRNRGRIWDPSQ